MFPHGRVHKNQTSTVEERELTLSAWSARFCLSLDDDVKDKDNDDADHNDADDKFSLQMNLSHAVF